MSTERVGLARLDGQRKRTLDCILLFDPMRCFGRVPAQHQSGFFHQMLLGLMVSSDLPTPQTWMVDRVPDKGSNKLNYIICTYCKLYTYIHIYTHLILHMPVCIHIYIYIHTHLFGVPFFFAFAGRRCAT